MKQIKINHTWRNITGIRMVVTLFGILCGLTGIIAGYYEILQGNIKPDGMVISSIGSNYLMSEDFTYFAVTVIPSFLATGVLAIIFSSLVILWSIRFIHRKSGAIVFLGLSAAQMLVGGGWVIDLAIIASILATRIGKPLNWWRKNLPENVRIGLAKLFPVSLLAYALISLSMLVLTFIGVNNESLIKLLEPLAVAMFIPIILMILAGVSVDISESLVDSTS